MSLNGILRNGWSGKVLFWIFYHNRILLFWKMHTFSTETMFLKCLLTSFWSPFVHLAQSMNSLPDLGFNKIPIFSSESKSMRGYFGPNKTQTLSNSFAGETIFEASYWVNLSEDSSGNLTPNPLLSLELSPPRVNKYADLHACRKLRVSLMSGRVTL